MRIIFWGNSSNSKIVFTLQKKIIRIIVSANLVIHVEVHLRD